MIDAILVGEIIMLPGANSAQSQPLWDDELDFLYNLDKIVDTALLPPQTQVLVESSRKRLRVFGPSAARRKTAIERIVKRLGEVKRRLMTIEFGRSLLKYYAHAADNQLAPAFGQSNVWLDAAACKISVAGTGAINALKEVQKRAPRPNALLDLFLRGDDGARNEAEEAIRCPVCLERAMCPVEGLESWFWCVVPLTVLWRGRGPAGEESNRCASTPTGYAAGETERSPRSSAARSAQ
ncbi:hypothetical protein PIIN_11479 [Serendipita indica DSM 11827]|uniref:Uncharacterized protein n=1 Tax=Serendipita indica (strain DSM 11827) TaxID=1109443 RepID=G4U1Q9_SERID|nr:hypothetical protein PIIN_11479 [Serendipita indica DSM 11827]